MATSLYDLSAACFLQTVGAMQGVLAKGQEHAKSGKLDLAALVDTRLTDDMLPFRFQVEMVALHSLGAIEGVKKGVFSPPGDPSARDYAGLQALLAETQAGLKDLTRQEVDALEGRDVVFQFKEFKLPFTAEGFLLSFSLPNLHFHAATAYDILRMKGVAIGKRDYLGQLRLKM